MFLLDTPAYGPAKLPNYEEATTLPSYEEAERTKDEQEQAASQLDSERGVSLCRKCNISVNIKPAQLSLIS